MGRTIACALFHSIEAVEEIHVTIFGDIAESEVQRDTIPKVRPSSRFGFGIRPALTSSSNFVVPTPTSLAASSRDSPRGGYANVSDTGIFTDRGLPLN